MRCFNFITTNIFQSAGAMVELEDAVQIIESFNVANR